VTNRLRAASVSRGAGDEAEVDDVVVGGVDAAGVADAVEHDDVGVGVRAWKDSARARMRGMLLPEPARWRTPGGRGVERRYRGESRGTSPVVNGGRVSPTMLRTSRAAATARAAEDEDDDGPQRGE
jgi:hypothetical protein